MMVYVSNNQNVSIESELTGLTESHSRVVEKCCQSEQIQGIEPGHPSAVSETPRRDTRTFSAPKS